MRNSGLYSSKQQCSPESWPSMGRSLTRTECAWMRAVIAQKRFWAGASGTADGGAFSGSRAKKSEPRRRKLQKAFHTERRFAIPGQMVVSASWILRFIQFETTKGKYFFCIPPEWISPRSHA